MIKVFTITYAVIVAVVMIVCYVQAARRATADEEERISRMREQAKEEGNHV